MSEEKESTMHSLMKGRSMGNVRCLQCFERISFPSGATQAACPKCGFEWRLSWNMGPDFPRIRGPVWETNEKLVKQMTEKGEKEK
ncbi:hypothetical protein ACFLYQ_04430 [Chloroflexota bacterium]